MASEPSHEQIGSAGDASCCHVAQAPLPEGQTNAQTPEAAAQPVSPNPDALLALAPVAPIFFGIASAISPPHHLQHLCVLLI